MTLFVLILALVGGYFLYTKYQQMPSVTVSTTGTVGQPTTPTTQVGVTGILGGIFNGLFPQVQQAEQTIANLVIVVAAWGLVIALELVLVIWLLARRR